MKGRDVEAGKTGYRGQKGGPVFLGGIAQEVEQGGEDDFALADGDSVKKGGQGFRVGGNGGTAGNEERVAPVPLLGPEGQAGLLQHGHQVEIVHLEGDGEAQQSKIAHVAARLQRAERPGLCTAAVPKDALADHVRLGVEQAIQSVNGQAGHAQVVSVGEGQRYRQPATPLFVNGASFAL